jgi:hypothetical protein
MSPEYLAGLVDADGCITIHKQQPPRKYQKASPVYTVTLEVSNNCLSLMEDLKKYFNGNIYSDKRAGRNITYKWVVSSRMAEPVLAEIISFMRVKKLQARLGLTFLKLPRAKSGIKVPDWLLELREMFYLKCKELNSNGTKKSYSKSESCCSA